MIPASFAEENAVLDSEQDFVQPLCVWRGKNVEGLPVVISCWKPTVDELEEIKRTGRVWLMIYGQTMPPAVILGRKPWDTTEPENVGSGG